MLDGCTVLVVEDEFLILLHLRRVLERHGAEVVTARSLAEGRRVVDDLSEKSTLDAAVLDVRLPDGEVFPLAHELQERGVPLIFHSSEAAVIAAGGRWPAAAALKKPTDERTLVAAVAKQANGSQVGPRSAIATLQ